MFLEVKESLDAYDHLCTNFDVEKDQEWMEAKRELVKKAEVAEAEALFLYCLKKGEYEEGVTADGKKKGDEGAAAEALCSQARLSTPPAIFESMFQPIKDAVAKAEEYKQYKDS